ncbi:Crp/Fnr family transcriptional regulator [Ekhidna sp.]|uniref:Crp/Fnr family transcriptional regulator n=1 Tax=Ekhidna sp. TaxID=2608089 RepID=UPI003C7E0675
MDTQKIQVSLNQIHPITDEAWNEFVQLFELYSLNPNAYLVRVGDRTHYCYLLTEGVVRVFHSKEGNEYNKTFFIPGMFPTALTSLLSESPSQLSFQALTSCQLIRFSYKKFRSLFDEHRCLETFMLRILEREWIKKEKHDIQMVTNDATTNYRIFRETYPGLENQIPQYHIASYLGITPIQLSRIRAQLAKPS